MKRITKYLLMLVIFLVPILKVNALSLSKSEVTIEVGKSDSVELYANIPEDKNIGNCNDWYDAFCYTWLDFVEYVDLAR